MKYWETGDIYAARFKGIKYESKTEAAKILQQQHFLGVWVEPQFFAVHAVGEAWKNNHS